MALDTSYEWLASGSKAASTAAPHSVFESASGVVGALNANQVLWIHIQASGANMRLLSTDGASIAGDGMLLSVSSLAYEELPPMVRSDASQLHFRNDTAADNAVARWVLWVRRSA